MSGVTGDGQVVAGDGAPAPPVRGRRRGRFWTGAAASVLVVGVALRLWTPSDLWLDEALSVNIARLPLDEIPDALRRDGAPPLYYFLLHLWMKVFGSGDWAVRALSGVFSLAALPAIWAAGRRLGGRATAQWALILLVASPFAIRFATEARMYSLAMLLALLGYLAVVRALESPSLPRLAAVAVVTGGLLLTHYWAFYLVALGAAALVVCIRKGSGARSARRVLMAVGAGLAFFLPWTPVFLFQLRHTGTPWAGRPPPGAVVSAFNEFGGGGGYVGPICAVLLLTLAALGLFGRAGRPGGVELDLKTRPEGRPLAFAAVGLVALGVVMGTVGNSGFQPRYASMALPLFVLLAALGVRVLGSRSAQIGLVAVVSVAGLYDGAEAGLRQRTYAGKVADLISARATPGDVVAYCPDQLGPSVSRLLPSGFDQVTFPRGTGPEFVDWVDYQKVNQAADPYQFGDELLERASGKDLWLVWSGGYKTLKWTCDFLVEHLESRRPGMERVARVNSRYFEHPGLMRFPG